MEKLQDAGHIVRKVALMTLIGFLAVILAGPILTVIGVLLPFALIGFLVWAPVKLLVVAKNGGWPAVRATTHRVAHGVLAVPVWTIYHLGAGLKYVVLSVFGLIGFLGGIILPTIAGAFLGAVLGLVGGMNHNDADVRIPAGAVIGGSIGLVAGAWRSKPAKRIVIRPVADGLTRA
jgi:hypothetical protein